MLGVPNIIWIATIVGIATGAASGITTGEVWIAITGGTGAGIAILAPFLVKPTKEEEDLLVYDSEAEDPAFATWTYHDERRVFRGKFSNDVTEDGRKALGLASLQGESVGVNKSAALTAGVIEFDYMVSGPDSVGGVYFAVLPMQETGIGRTGLIEVGGSVQGDPVNPTSPYRLRYFVPDAYRNDGHWHHHRMEFDFKGIPNAFYVIFAPRINEGIKDRSLAVSVCVTGVRIWRKSGAYSAIKPK